MILCQLEVGQVPDDTLFPICESRKELWCYSLGRRCRLEGEVELFGRNDDVHLRQCNRLSLVKSENVASVT